MMDGPYRRHAAPSKKQIDDRAARVSSTLAIALSQEAVETLPRHVLEPNSYVSRITYDDMDTVVLTGPDAPDLVLAPLLTPMFDALDLARYLSQAGYRGRYLALVDRLPSANLIRREVEAQSPDLNFDIVVLDGSTPLHSL